MLRSLCQRVSALPASLTNAPDNMTVCWRVLEGGCWSVLECVGVCRSVLECVGVCWSVLECIAVIHAVDFDIHEVDKSTLLQ